MTTTALSSQAQATPTRVILVEDNHDLRQSLADYLRLSGFIVTDVPSGVAFYKTLRSETFDIAILDVNLPDISGFTLASELAAEQRIGIIMLTARAGPEDHIRGYKEGADIYLTKPVDSEALALAIRNLARRLDDTPSANPDASTTLKVWKLDTIRQCLIAPNGRLTRLTGRELIVLEHLARTDGGTLPRATLDTVLGYDNKGPDNRGLDAVVHRLRQKVEETGTELPLRVVHAVGFRFSGSLTID